MIQRKQVEEERMRKEKEDEMEKLAKTRRRVQRKL